MVRKPKPSGKKPGLRLKSRRAPRTEIKKRYLIVTEGLRTEPLYFEGLRRTLGNSANFHLTIHPKRDSNGKWNSSPTAVVKKCAELKQRDLDDCREKGKHRDKIPYSRCFAVVDVDHWNTTSSNGSSTLRSAIANAERNGISVVISNAKFETWLLWHSESRITCDSNQLAKKCEERRLLIGKEIPSSFPYANYPSAAQNADSQNRTSLNEIGKYPSTSLPRLLEEIGAMDLASDKS